ncbi:MAG: 23S rRNA (uracil(1939)-C(5))-methyltransferase RlmD [Bacilli bacterium]|nr:23S rRNA (uracil(1939)-C(5))-methyltransferase RlmD [Bacilli bacterium]MDD4282731.1 23S rRNA (uracil(1939)-C(5))-methyltransferase RlmD [Bacilli bacterium]MDD4719004.1 23S rRNA (uracil(1939)-C(5))-methyltransferase RlmD [Bacilli bacterium]
MTLYNIYEVDIVAFDHQGRGIGKIFDKTIFIPNALVGETVKFKLTTIKKKYLEGELVTILKSSNNRIKPICPYFSECGGCDLMHISYDNQLKYKENKVKEIFTKFTTINPSLIRNIVSCNDIYNYRNKVTLQVNNEVGFYKKKTNEIVKISKCSISNDGINKIIKELNKLKSFDNIKQIVIKSSKFNNEIMVVIYTSGNIDESDIIKNLSKHVSSIIKYDNSYQVIYGKPYITEKMNDLEFMISPSSFFQVNTEQAIKLYDLILKFADLKDDEIIVDLYCGTGTIGLYLSHYCKNVIGVEVNEDAIQDANKNKKLNGINNIDFISGDVTKVINDLRVSPDIIIVDPPRSGLDDNIINNLKKYKPNKIIYVSCNPITLARDLEKLSESYNIENITPVDMFANTYHVEVVVYLSLKKVGTYISI